MTNKLTNPNSLTLSDFAPSLRKLAQFMIENGVIFDSKLNKKSTIIAINRAE